MRKYLLVGDTHGDLEFAEQAALLARDHAAEVLQCGDWGFLWPGNDKLTDLSDMLVGLGVTMRAIDGNHDDHPRLRNHVKACVATTIAPRVIYQPRGSVHEDADGTRFLFCGGAPSIDRAFRTQGRSWWPEEVITRDDRDRALSVPGPVHVVVTHDAPAFPPGFSAKGTPSYQHDQEQSMRYVDDLVRHHHPSLHVHGHWHVRATTFCGSTRVEALASNLQLFDDAVLLWSRTNETL